MLIVDRIEETLVVCEQDDRSMIALPLSDFLYSPKSGDVLRQSPEGQYFLDEETTNSRKETLKNRFARLHKKNQPPH